MIYFMIKCEQMGVYNKVPMSIDFPMFLVFMSCRGVHIL